MRRTRSPLRPKPRSVPYVLVILRGGPRVDDEHAHAPAHRAFIDSMIRRNIVLLGGAFASPIEDAYAAYLLRCSGTDEAAEITAEDPFVVHEVVRPEFVEWELVGINPEAIDESAVVRPRDVA